MHCDFILTHFWKKNKSKIEKWKRSFLVSDDLPTRVILLRYFWFCSFERKKMATVLITIQPSTKTERTHSFTRLFFFLLWYNTRTLFVFVIGSDFVQVWVPFLEGRGDIFKGSFQIGIDKDTIKVTSLISVIQFFGSIAQSCLDGLFRFCATSTQSFFQFCLRWWSNENVNRLGVLFSRSFIHYLCGLCFFGEMSFRIFCFLRRW